MSPVTRGFHGKPHRPPASRVPPGQHVVGDFPVLSAGPTPHKPLKHWTFSITGGRQDKRWTWEEFRALPAETITVDIHCVTSWSKLDTRWKGVSLDVLLAQVEHDARYVLAFSDGGYTTNMPLADLTGGRAWVAFGYGGGPLGPEHGGPARLLVPHLYFWKSAKWVRGLRLRDTDEPGFWETYGYHMYSRPMAGTAVRGRLTWQTVSASSVIEETPRVRTIFIDVPDWPGHRAGQHVDIRLTAEDGYQAERAYSIASAPGEPLSITVERLEDGEVSPYLTEELRPGDLFEVRGPIGGYFVWGPADGGPLLLLAAGSGVVPLRSMLRYRKRLGSGVPVRLLYSSRSWEDVIYRAELLSDGLQVIHALTREQPRGWTGYARRVDRQMLAEVAWPAGQAPLAYACGPTSFVETVAAGLTELGYPPERIKTERFGATGS